MKYKCRVCSGQGKVDAGWTGPLIIDCGNCEGTGYCDWIRNAIPLYYDEKENKWIPSQE